MHLDFVREGYIYKFSVNFGASIKIYIPVLDAVWLSLSLAFLMTFPNFMLRLKKQKINKKC